MTTPSSPKVDHTKEVRFAVVMYGGVSLAIYINGIAQELLSLVRSTAEAYEDDGTNRSLSGAPVESDDHAAIRAQKLRGTERAYRKLSYLLSDPELLQQYKESLSAGARSQFGQKRDMLDEYLANGKGKGPPPITTGFIVDILSGTSAGGINAIFLAKALANNQSIDKLKQLWVQEGDIGLLINDKQSLAGLNLQNQDPPKSLLNSRRMYLQLLKAFDGMDAQKPSKADHQSPYVQELDLFVTTTDLKGTVVPLQLCDKLVYEKRHRNVFHLKYGTRQEFGTECNHFLRKYNPFLAFAARCTSSFPFAFEPMRLSDLDSLLTSFGDSDYKANGSQSELWKPFFRENIDVVFADDTQGGAGTLDFTSRVKRRSYADGGYLDNKPFSYATESLSHRQSTVPVERKLIYIEPSPEHPEDELQDETPPNVLLNAKAALIDLPTYETIREDLQRVLQRNRTFQRIARIVEATKQDIEKIGRDDRRYDVKPSQWRLMDMQMMVEYRGIYFLPYRRLRIASVTDDLTSVIAKVKNLDERSDQFIAVRGLLRALRDKQYVENYNPQNTQLVREILANNISPNEKPTEVTQNGFLDEFDYSYRFRRLNFVLEKIDFLTQLAVQDEPADDESDYVKQARARINEAGRKETLEVLSFLKSELTEVHKTLRTAIRRLQAGPEAIAEMQVDPPLPLNRLLKPELLQAIVDFYKSFDKLKLDERQLKYVLGVPGQVSKDGFITLTPAEDEQFARLDENTVNRRANELYEKDATLKSLLDDIANKLKATLRDLIIRPTSDHCARLLDPGKPLPDAVSTARLDQSSGEISKLSQQIIRGYLYDFYVNFDDYDQVLFPILYQTEFGESAAVDVFRISPEDAPSLINERGQDADGRQKLAGTALFHFGAFLDRVWRENDIMWGRLDGAERLITALLPDPEYRAVRDELISEAHVAILLEEMPAKTRLELTVLLSDALIRASSGESFNDVLEKVVGPLKSTKVKQRLESAMRACLEDEQLLSFVQEHYQVNRELEPKPLLRSVARATQVTGKIFDDIAKANRVDSKSIRWVARAGQLFWGLVEVAVPGSIANLVFQHGLKLIYMFEFLLVLFGTVFANPSVQQLGWLTLAITVTVHTAQLVLTDTMRGRHWWRYLIIGPAALFLLAIVGFGIAAFIGIFYKPAAWNALLRIQAWSASLTPPGRKAVQIGLLVGVGAFILGAFWSAIRARLRTRLLGLLPLLLGLLFAGGTIFGFADSKNFSEALPRGLHVPGLAIEMSTDPNEVVKIEKIVSKSEADARVGAEKLRKINVNLDSAFIALYTLVFLIFSYWLSRRRLETAMGLAIAAVILAITTAGFDILENVRLSAVFDSTMPSPLMIQNLHNATLMKWTFCFLTTGVLSVLFLSRKDYGYLLGLGLLIVSVLGIFGLFNPRVLEFTFIGLGAMQFLIGLFIVIFPDRFRAGSSAPESP